MQWAAPGIRDFGYTPEECHSVPGKYQSSIAENLSLFAFALSCVVIPSLQDKTLQQPDDAGFKDMPRPESDT